MQLIGELPLSALGELLSYAEEQELQPLWIANFVISKITDREHIPYNDFIDAVFNDEKTPKKAKENTPSEIEAEFSKIANIERARLKKEE